jgi:hypothetical protein
MPSNPNVTGLTSAANALKTFFLPSLRYQLNIGASVVFAQFERGKEGVVGSSITMALRYGRNGGYGSGSDISSLPVTNSRQTAQANWQTKNLYARIQLSDKLLKASRSNVGAFANMFKQELQDCQDDAKENVARSVFWDGSGVLAVVNVASGSTTTINQYTPFTNYSIGGINVLAEGMLCDVWAAGSYPTTQRNTPGTPIQITAVNNATSTVTWNVTCASIGMVSTDYIVVQNVASGTTLNGEITGLGAIFNNNTTLYNINRSSNYWFNAQVPTAVNGEISEVVIQAGIDNSRMFAAGHIKFIVTSFGVRRAYQYMLQSQKRQINTLELKGGWKALEYQGGEKSLPITADQYCPTGSMFLLDTDDFKVYELEDWTWMDEDGAILSRVANIPAYEATMVKYCDIGCQKPRAQVWLQGIVEH